MSYPQFEEETNEYSVDGRDEELKNWRAGPIVPPTAPAGHILSYVGGPSVLREPNSDAGRYQASHPSFPAIPSLPDPYSPAAPSLPDAYHQQYNAVRQATSPDPFYEDTRNNAKSGVLWAAYQKPQSWVYPDINLE